MQLYAAEAETGLYYIQVSDVTQTIPPSPPSLFHVRCATY